MITRVRKLPGESRAEFVRRVAHTAGELSPDDAANLRRLLPPANPLDAGIGRKAA